MRILVVTNLYPPLDIGGYEQWCQEVAEGLQRKGHVVEVLTSNYRSTPAEADPAHPVSRALHLETDLNYYRMSDFFFKRPRQNMQNRQALQNKAAAFQPDVIFIWGMWSLSNQVAKWAEEMFPGKVAYFISSYWPMDPDPHSQFWRLPVNHRLRAIIKAPLRKWVFRQLRREGYPPTLHFEHAVCCSRFVRQRLIEAGKLPESAGVLYGGCDADSFFSAVERENDKNNSRLQLLYFGRLIQDKGVHTAVEALGILKERGQLDRVDLTILGSGHPEYEETLQNLVKRLGVGSRTFFKEKVAREKIPTELAKFDVYLFTSIWPEPMARSVMEAMAAGLLVIGTEAGGQREMLHHGQNALTFPPEDAVSLADHIGRVLDDPAERLNLARKGQEMVQEKFTLARMVDDIEAFLTRIQPA